MLFYSMRDGFLGIWLKVWWHGLRGLRREIAARKLLSKSTMLRIREIDAHRPVFWQLAWDRMRSRSPINRLEGK